MFSDLDSYNGSKIYDQAYDGIEYLDMRKELWMQEQPLKRKPRNDRKKTVAYAKHQTNNWVAGQLAKIDEGIWTIQHASTHARMGMRGTPWRRLESK